MKIDAGTGEVSLSGGFTFNSSLTQEAFRAQRLHDPVRVTNPGTPWYYHPFQDGAIDGHPLNVSLCFYRDVLVSFSFGVNLYPPDAKGWDDYSEATEAAMQDFHAALLANWFGPPHQQITRKPRSKEFPQLAIAREYNFPWGNVWCAHDPRSGSTEILVRYPKNDEWARADYGR